MKNDPRLKKRILMCVLGVLVCGISVGLFKRAALGVDPFQSFMGGLDELVPIEFGTLYVIANACLLLFSLVADRHYIGLATIINLLLLGYVVQFTQDLLFAVFPELSMAGRFAFLAIGIVLICFSSAFYFVADLGVSTYDAVALIITSTWKIGKFSYVRVITDCVCVGVGVILYGIAKGSFDGISAVVGIGTIITAFFMGPLIDLFREKVAKPFLYGKEK